MCAAPKGLHTSTTIVIEVIDVRASWLSKHGKLFNIAYNINIQMYACILGIHLLSTKQTYLQHVQRQVSDPKLMRNHWHIRWLGLQSLLGTIGLFFCEGARVTMKKRFNKYDQKICIYIYPF